MPVVREAELKAALRDQWEADQDEEDIRRIQPDVELELECCLDRAGLYLV